MYSDIGLLHHTGCRHLNKADFGLKESDRWLHWGTCLRQIAFVEADVARLLPENADVEIRYGLDAYRFCLEVTCGLRSPLIGETEVFGQFKNAVQNWLAPREALALQGPWGAQFRRFTTGILEDAKKARQAHLDGIGSQSYGSVVRRELRGALGVHVIGSGHLVAEILPWIAKTKTSVTVHSRDVNKALVSLGPVAPSVIIRPMSLSVPASGALIIAAPLSGHEIDAWAGASRFSLLIDLRSDSEVDRPSAALAPRSLTLRQIMSSVDSNQARIQMRKQAALKQIEDLTASRGRYVEFRPFGWEDVCA